MPDYGGQAWIERRLEQIEVTSYGDASLPDYGTTLLETSSTQHHLSGGRKVNGGVMFLQNYRCPTVNIRAPKWQDNVFWIKAEDYEAAQWIADAVYYLTGRGPFHFKRNHFNYPPLLLGTGELLNTREKCSVHVAKIAKGPALLSERGAYKERVKKLVLEAVKHPDVVQFLNSLRAIARVVPIAIPEAANNSEEEALSSPEGRAPMEVDALSEEEALSSPEGRAPMEVDALSEEAIRSLVPAVHVDAVSMFRAADTSTFEDVDLSTAYVASFGMDLDEPENILLSVGQSIGYDFHRKAKEFPIPSNLTTFLEILDKEEDDVYKSIDRSAWEPYSSPRLNEACYTLRY